MELLFGIFLFAVCNAELAYLPPQQAAAAGGHGGGGHGGGEQLYVNGDYGGGEPQQYARSQAAYERNARILKHESELTAHGYQYAYETENGIRAHESGTSENGVQAQGSYSYTGDDGQVYTISYTADANGFQAQGDHLPTPPPTPEAILKALEQNARDEAAGISDDGSYREDQQHQSIGNGGAQYYSQSQYQQPAQIGHSAQFGQTAQHAQSGHFGQPAQYSQSAQYSQASQGGQGYHY